MIELTSTVGQKLLFEGKYEYAIPAAMQSLKFSIEVYGIASIELVPSYLILGEACIGKNLQDLISLRNFERTICTFRVHLYYDNSTVFQASMVQDRRFSELFIVIPCMPNDFKRHMSLLFEGYRVLKQN